MQRNYSIPFGNTAVELALDAELIEPRTPPPVPDETAAIRHALETPIGALPLRQVVKPGEKIVIIVNDATRMARTDLVLPPIVDALNQAGVPDADILVVFALGIHRKQTDEERRLIVGDEMFRRLRLLDHDCYDEANLVHVGATSRGNAVNINRQVWEADRIILTGEIIYHLIAGFSGGRKSILPGVAGWRTTTFNHSMIFDPRCTSGVLEGNPAHEDMLEGARMVEPDFIVNVVLTGSGRLAHVVAGHFEQAHREGCRVARNLLSTRVEAPFDIVIASAGGYPLDTDLRQAHKGMENACRALKPGGVLFYYADCANGLGIRSIEEYLTRYDTAEEMEKALKQDFVVGGHKAWWLRRLGRDFRVYLVSSLEARKAERCGYHAVAPADHANKLKTLLAAAGPQARVAVMPHAGSALPVVAEAGGA